MIFFSIYTGLSYGDFERITRDKIRKNTYGQVELKERRIKTGEPFIVPIWDEAAEILQKYEGHPDVVNDNFLMPTIKNQKFNINLKKIAKLCGIDRNLTHHMGRHTFATYYILEEKRMSIEALRIMLGHTNIKMTQLYGKLTENRLASEIQECKERELSLIA